MKHLYAVRQLLLCSEKRDLVMWESGAGEGGCNGGDSGDFGRHAGPTECRH